MNKLRYRTIRSLQASLLVILLSVNPWVLRAQAFELAPKSGANYSEFAQQYTALTKQILLKGIEVERFSLKYRLESFRQPRFRRLRFFGTQEAGAASALGFEIITDKQLKIGRNHPLKVSQPAMHAALASVTTGVIIAGAGSAVELGSNTLLAIKHKHQGLDPRSANQFVIARVKELDELLAQLKALVETHRDHPAYERAVAEGKILSAMRRAFIIEYGQFHADARGYGALTNLFYLFNVATAAVGATGGGVGYKAVTVPKFNGPSNILFVITGAMVMASPLLATAAATLVRKHDYDSVLRQLGQDHGTGDISSAREELSRLLSNAKGTLMPSMPASDRLALYTQSDELFRKQLANETFITNQLGKVAIQSSLIGPVIGGALMTQGILGTAGYYKYTFRPRKQLNYFYHGAIVGTTAAGAATVGTAACLLASYWYENHLRKQHRLPSQLIDDRLAHLDEVEQLVLAL